MYEQHRLDESTYDASRVYLRAALEQMLEAGRSVRELSEFALDRFGADFLPYLRQFLHEVGHGRISVSGLSGRARAALAGHSVNSEQRECMIREAAYLRAEARGFCGGSPEADWLEAEREVDLRLAQGPGLVVKGGRTLAAVVKMMEEELAGSRDVVARWLGDRFPASARQGGAASGAQASGSRAARAPAARKKASTRKKAAVKKPATQKKAVARAPASKAAGAKPAKKKTASARGTSAAGSTSGSRTGTKKKAATATTRKKTAAKKRSAGTARKSGRAGTRRT